MSMSEPAVLLEAKFDPRVKSYWIWQPVLVLIIIIITIPIALLYMIIARFFIDRYLENMRCALTERTLDIKKGILNKTESTIPLEKITDLQLFQGPVMRFFGLHGFKVETAGQSSPTGGSLVNIVGIVNTKDFRRAVLEQRDRVSSGAATRPPAAIPAAGTGDSVATELLTEIRDSLRRIEGSLRNSGEGT
jgi:putative membrane protein